jgi:hypothetical protein
VTDYHLVSGLVTLACVFHQLPLGIIPDFQSSGRHRTLDPSRDIGPTSHSEDFLGDQCP